MAKAQVSEIDRLIELASDNKPGQAAATEMPHQTNRSLSLPDPGDQREPKPSMWRMVLQMRVLLPYLARVLPVLERSVLGTNVLSGAAPAQHTAHFERGLAGLEDAHRDLTAQVKNQASEMRSQSAEMKFLQEQVGWLGKSIEKHAQRQEEIAESLASLRRMLLLLTSGIVGLVLLATLLVIDQLKPSLLR